MNFKDCISNNMVYYKLLENFAHMVFGAFFKNECLGIYFENEIALIKHSFILLTIVFN